jgi:hypothetical protein
LCLSEVCNLEDPGKQRHVDDVVLASGIVIALRFRRRIVQKALRAVERRAGILRFEGDHDSGLQSDEQIDLSTVDSALPIEVWEGWVMAWLRHLALGRIRRKQRLAGHQLRLAAPAGDLHVAHGFQSCYQALLDLPTVAAPLSLQGLRSVKRTRHRDGLANLPQRWRPASGYPREAERIRHFADQFQHSHGQNIIFGQGLLRDPVDAARHQHAKVVFRDGRPGDVSQSGEHFVVCNDLSHQIDRWAEHVNTGQLAEQPNQRLAPSLEVRGVSAFWLSQPPIDKLIERDLRLFHKFAFGPNSGSRICGWTWRRHSLSDSSRGIRRRSISFGSNLVNPPA